METLSKHITKGDNAIIQIAAHIADKGFEGATSNEVIKLFHRQNLLTDFERDELTKFFKFDRGGIGLDGNIETKFNKLVFQLESSSSFKRSDDRLSITFEGLSSLQDFIELKYARKNAREAKIFSGWAILISILALIISTVFGYKQLYNKIEIEDSQLKYLHEINDYSIKLDSVILELKQTNNHLSNLNIKKNFLKTKKEK